MSKDLEEKSRWQLTIGINIVWKVFHGLDGICSEVDRTSDSSDRVTRLIVFAALQPATGGRSNMFSLSNDGTRVGH